jgi:hypothetical protein
MKGYSSEPPSLSFQRNGQSRKIALVITSAHPGRDRKGAAFMRFGAYGADSV